MFTEKCFTRKQTKQSTESEVQEGKLAHGFPTIARAERACFEMCTHEKRRCTCGRLFFCPLGCLVISKFPSGSPGNFTMLPTLNGKIKLVV